MIVLDFNKIENDLKEQLLKKDDTSTDINLFYPNIQPYHQYKKRDNYEKDQNRIETVYKKIFGGEPSIIHYILSNKSFLFKISKPDITKRQQKRDNNSKHMIHLNMKQSVYILRLLLFKYKIISPDVIYEDQCTIMTHLEEELRGQLIENTFEYNDIKQLYLKLIVDIHSISDNIRQSAIFNILYFEKTQRYYHVNFFDNIDMKECGWGSPKMPLKLIQTLLFRGIPPLSIQVFEECSTEQFKSDKNNFDIAQKLGCFIDEVMKLDWKLIVPRTDIVADNVTDTYWTCFIQKLRAATAPLIIYDLAILAKQNMRQILNECIIDTLSDDCIDCILDFVYMDLQKLYSNDIEQNTIIKVGKYFNFIHEIDLTQMESSKNILNKQYLTESVAKFLFNEIGEDIQGQILKDIYKRDGIIGLETLYELVKMKKFSRNVLNKFMYHMIYGWTEMRDDIKELFVNIVSVNMFNSDKLNNKSFLTNYKNELSDKVDKLYNANYVDHDARIWAEVQFIDHLLET